MGRSETGLPALSVNGDVYGSYIHGIFDEAGIAQAIVSDLCQKKGLDTKELESFDPEKYKQQQYDLLAQGVRQGLNMEFVYRVLNREV